MHTEKSIKTTNETMTNVIFLLYRFVIVLTMVSLFIPGLNPAKISGLINENMSLFTVAISYSELTENTIRAITRGWVQSGSFVILYIASIITVIGFMGSAVSACMSLGSLKLRRRGNLLAIIGGAVSCFGFGGIIIAYSQLSTTSNFERVLPEIPMGFYVTLGLMVIIIALSLVLLIIQPKATAEDVIELKQKYKLFLLILPFIILTFLFSYLNLWGWRYAFFDYKAGTELTMDKFVGFKWFTYLFKNIATRDDIRRVMINTFAMSGLGLAFSWVPMVFAIFLCEIKNLHIRRFVQTFTTIPNFISWVLIYAVATVIFSSDGLISNLIVAGGGNQVNFLLSSKYIWLKMFAWGLWKGVGWSAIIYIAGISGIDQQLFEAATVDGAGRFQKMWHVTVPGLIPTFVVLFVMAVAGILSNGLDQYLVFKNPRNMETIEVLDLYVYQIGISDGKIPLSTVVGMCKSIISVVLLFAANKVSKIIRGNSIV